MASFTAIATKTEIRGQDAGAVAQATGEAAGILALAFGGTMIDKQDKHEYAVALVEWIACGALTQAEIEEEVHSFAKDHCADEPATAWDYLADIATERGITSERTEVRA